MRDFWGRVIENLIQMLRKSKFSCMAKKAGLKRVVDLLYLSYMRKRWRKCNPDNETYIDKYCFDHTLVQVGVASYGGLNVVSFGGKNRLIIGNYVSIAQNVSFLLNAEHETSYISTYPFKVKLINKERYEAYGKGDIIIEDDVWIGFGATVMSGVRVSQGAVVAAGAVVTKDVPPYSIVGGVPAKVIKYRFKADIISQLLNVDYKHLNQNIIQSHLDDLYTELIDCRQLEWLPKK